MAVIIDRQLYDGKYYYRLSQYGKGVSTLEEQALIKAIQEGNLVKNAVVENGKLKGSNGSLDRFDYFRKTKGTTPFVILAEYVDESDNTVGFKMVNNQGVTKSFNKNVALKAAISCGLQNGKVVTNTAGSNQNTIEGKYFISAINGTYDKIKVRTQKPVQVKLNKEYKKEDKESKFTKGQLYWINKGKAENLNYTCYTYTAFSAEQMEQIYLGLKSGINVRYYLHPDFKVECMEMIRLESENKFNVRPYANPAYNKAQMLQIKLGYEVGVNYSVYANADIPAKTMETYRIRLESEMWDKEIGESGGLMRKVNIIQM
jgi:hypothetical protein